MCATDCSLATPENLAGSPLKKKRPNRISTTTLGSTLDFRLSHDAQKALSQMQDELKVLGSALTVRPVAAVTCTEHASEVSSCVVRKVQEHYSDRDERVSSTSKQKTVSSLGQSDSSSESLKVKPSQVRKRPRLIIRESLPSDEEEYSENGKSSSLGIHRVNESQSSVRTKSLLDVKEKRTISSVSLQPWLRDSFILSVRMRIQIVAQYNRALP